MDIIANDFLSELKKLEMCLPTTSINPILDCFLLEANKIHAFNGRIYGCVNCNDLDIGGYVNAKNLINIVLSLGKRKIKIEIINGILKITSGKFKAEMSTIAKDKDHNDIELFLSSFKKETLKNTKLHFTADTIKRCKSILSDSMQQFMGVFGKDGYCTDGYRFYKFSIEGFDCKKIIVPLTLIEVLSSISNVKSVKTNGNIFSVLCENGYYVCTSYNTEMENYEKKFSVLEKRFSKIKSIQLTDKVKKAIDRISVCSKLSLDKLCRVTLNAGSVTVSSNSDLFSIKDIVKGIDSKESWSIECNYQHLLELLECSGNKISFGEYDKENGILFNFGKEESYVLSVKNITGKG
jgi:DNA polymerase III sliding clamp (beta) subunit (PCNA family)